MDVFADIVQALTILFAPYNLLACAGGLFLGVLFGTLPGLSVMSAIIIVLPLTYVMSAETSLILLTSVYAAGVYGGSATAILLNIPGAPENAASALDGYPMTRKGQATKALGIAITSSALGGLLGTLVLIFLSPYMLDFALSIGNREFFLITVFGFIVAGGIHRGGLLKGYISVLMGILVACMGFSEIGGYGSNARLTFGIEMFNTGINFVSFAIGALALSEVLLRIGATAVSLDTPQTTSVFPSLREARRYLPTWLRCGCLGAVVGIIPGTGATVASFLSYFAEQKISPRGRDFGTGVPEGVAAPECANNCAAMTTLIPLLTLGIPGGAVAAIMYSAMQIHGVQPGPLLFEQNKVLVYTVYCAALLANVAIFFVGRSEVKNLSRLLRVPNYVLLPLITVLSIIGTFNISKDIFNVYIMVGSAVLALVMRRHNYSVIGMLLGMILCPIAERSLTRCLIMYESPFFLFETPQSCLMLALSVAFFIYVLLSGRETARDRDGLSPGEKL